MAAQNIEELNAFLLTLQYEAPPVAVTPSTGQALSKEKRLALCAQELVDTERVYIKVSEGKDVLPSSLTHAGT